MSTLCVCSATTTGLESSDRLTLSRAEKIEKEKAKSRDLESTCNEHLVVIDRLSEEYRAAMLQIDELQDRLESAEHDDDGHYTQEDLDAHLADASAREEEYESRINEMQVEIEDLQNDQAAYESDRRKWEADAAALQAKFDDKHDEFVKAMDDLEQLNSENEEYARKIESYEESAEALREQAEDYENSRVKYSALQIDYKVSYPLASSTSLRSKHHRQFSNLPRFVPYRKLRWRWRCLGPTTRIRSGRWKCSTVRTQIFRSRTKRWRRTPRG